MQENHLLNRVESQIDRLLESYAKLERENRDLKAREQVWLRERNELIEKNRSARNRVEALIKHLKDFEVDS